MTKTKAAKRRARLRRQTCESKVRFRYADEAVAVRVAVKLGKSHYRCPECGGWHLTSVLQQSTEG